MLALNTNQAALIAGNILGSAWLFDIVTALGVRHQWSLDVGTYPEVTAADTWDSDFYAPSYEFKIIPDSFSGIELQRNRSEFNMCTPADVKFTVGNAGNTLTASDFVDAQVTIRIRVSSSTDTQVLPGWRFVVQRCEGSAGKLDFHCTSFITRYLKGDWPNTELVRDLIVEETGTEVNDNYCVPIIINTAYIPLRSLYIADGRYYLIGPADSTYDIAEVSSPGQDQGKSTWLAASYSFTQGNRVLKSEGYRVFQPIIADANLDGTADSCGLWVSNGVVMDMPTKVTDNSTVDLSHPNRCIAYILKDFGVPADLIDDVEPYSTFTTTETAFSAMGVSFSGGYYFRRPRQEVLAELLNSCHSVLDVGERVELRLLSKTPRRTIGLGDVVVSSSGKERNSRDLLSAFKYDAILQVESDAGYVAFPAGDRTQSEMMKVLVSAKGGSDNISGTTIPLPLINDGIAAQSLACLYFQRRFLRHASLSFRGKPALLALQPDDVVTFDDAYFGGTYNALIESVKINRDLSINYSLTRFKEALDDWDDLAFSEVVPVIDGSSSSLSWTTVTAGPASSPDGGRMPNSLPGPLRIGQTGNYILLDPSEPVMSFAEGGVVRMKVGDLGIDDYGVQIWDANGVSILKINGSGVNTLSSWTLSAGKMSTEGIELDAANNRIKVFSGGNYVQMSADGLIGVDNILGTTINIPTNGDAPTFSSGIINTTVFNITESGILQTSATVGDGSALGQGIRINDIGIRGWGANDTTPKFFLEAGTGLLSAVGVTISGNITATTGAIGGFTIGATSLTSGVGPSTVGLSSSSTGLAIYAGAAIPENAPFRVTAEGTLTAIGANISGTLTITGGSGYANISDKPTTLSGINSDEGGKLAGIAAGATVGAPSGTYVGSTLAQTVESNAAAAAALAGSLGSLAYENAVEAAMLGTTVINGGYLVTDLVEAKSIFTAKINDNAVTQSVAVESLPIYQTDCQQGSAGIWVYSVVDEIALDIYENTTPVKLDCRIFSIAFHMSRWVNEAEGNAELLASSGKYLSSSPDELFTMRRAVPGITGANYYQIRIGHRYNSNQSWDYRLELYHAEAATVIHTFMDGLFTGGLAGDWLTVSVGGRLLYGITTKK